MPSAEPRSRTRLSRALRIMLADRLGLAGWIVLALLVLLAVGGGALAPYNPIATNYDAAGAVLRLRPPSTAHWLGTTNLGQDVWSQMLVGAQTPITVGLLSALFIAVIGTHVGLIAGYFGRWVDDVLMRFTDIAYGVPFLPFAILLISLTGVGTLNIVLAVSTLMWRTSARVVRAQVLSLRTAPFITAAELSGAGSLRIIYRYLAPHVLPLAMLYTAFGVSWGILAEASLGFLGLGDPERVSWGQMLFYAFRSGSMRTAWWWALPPGIAIMLAVISSYLAARTLEAVVDPRLRAR